MHGEDHQIVQKPRRLGIVAAHELIDRLDQLVRPEHFGRVKASVEPDDRLPFLRERARLIVVEAIDRRESPRDVFVAIQFLEILRRGDDRHQLRAAFGRLADLDDFHPIGFLVEFVPVLDELIVGGELVIVADIEAKVLLRGGNPLRCGRSGEAKKDRSREDQ